MKPLRISDLAFDAMLKCFAMAHAHYEEDNGDEGDGREDEEAALNRFAKFLEVESRARGFDRLEDALLEYKVGSETANDATAFDEIVKEYVIAIKGLRKIEKAAHKIHASDQHVPAQEVEDIAEEFCNMAHNALDEIGDDRESEL